jgi:putative membrane protein
MSMSTKLTMLAVLCWGASAAAMPSRPDASRPDTLLLSSGGEQKAAPSAGNTVSPADRQILQKLHDTNQLENQMGRLAQDRGSAKAVKDFGRQLIADHAQADRKIGDYLRQHGLDATAFASTTSSDPDHEVLATKSGVAFDHAFALQTAVDHQKALDLLEAARNDTSDDALRTLYDDLLVAVRAHKRAAQGLLSSKVRA